MADEKGGATSPSCATEPLEVHATKGGPFGGVLGGGEDIVWETGNFEGKMKGGKERRGKGESRGESKRERRLGKELEACGLDYM
jgi:hypothetical protein